MVEATIRWQEARAEGVQNEETAPGQRGDDEGEWGEGKQGETMAREMRWRKGRPEGGQWAGRAGGTRADRETRARRDGYESVQQQGGEVDDAKSEEESEGAESV